MSPAESIALGRRLEQFRPYFYEDAMPKLEQGCLVVPEGPGPGAELNEAAITKSRLKEKVLDTPLGFDGSVQDR